ncbi:MAG: right-handed parallel beta-helix repeat-containing protein [Opitutae bacterium]|nr:right-handed parallel beta-helix repeat-containing protein [Opitutae bacterium]
MLLNVGLGAPSGKIGADIPWTTIEAEDMRGTGTTLGPIYAPHRVEMESSCQRCVKLAQAGEHVEFASPIACDALVVRYHLPDAPKGGGLASSLALSVNGHVVRELALSSRDMWLYGAYPFSNDPRQAKPRNFYDELRVKGVVLARGDVVRLQKIAGDGVDCVIDLVDLEVVSPAVVRPRGSLSVLDYGAGGEGETDDTEALRRTIAAAQRKSGGIVWVPAGNYKVTGDIVIPSNVTIQGAGMWHTTFVGDAALYGDAARRVRLKLTGANVHMADFAVVGALNYRDDSEANDGIVGADCRDASISRVWVEHTKAGAWIYNGVNLVIEGCRFRNLLADGVNLCVGTTRSVVQNCSARGTGDDCYAIWPVPSDQGHDEWAEKPGHNVIRRCTGQLPFLANGASFYGGASNRIEDCLFTDITAGCGILLSTTFPTADAAGKVDNNFSGETVVQNCRLIRCGGYDHDWAWRSALQLCLHRRSIAGVRIRQTEIRDSLSEGLSVLAPGRAKGQGTLADARLEDVTIVGTGLGAPHRPAVWIRHDAAGGFTCADSSLGAVCNESADFVIRTDSH